jgi:hypothetical protein
MSRIAHDNRTSWALHFQIESQGKCSEELKNWLITAFIFLIPLMIGMSTN